MLATVSILPRRAAIAMAGALLLAWLASCGGSGGGSEGAAGSRPSSGAPATSGPGTGPGTGPGAGQAKPLEVVATIGMIGDIARQIAGERAVVSDLMGEGVDPHLYKASPGDVRRLADADLVLYNGLHLEGRLADTLVKLASRTPTVQVTETIPEELLRSPPEFSGHFDPHVWFDPALWAFAAERIGAALAEVDPAGREEYVARTAEVTSRLRALREWAQGELAPIPRDRRVLVTAHDAFGYFGRAFDIEVLAIQGVSTDSEASLRTINALVTTLVERRVPAVFVESSVPRRAVEALVEGCRSRGHEVRIGGELFSDAMGASGTPEGTYVGMVEHNVRTIVAALSSAGPGAGATRSAEAAAGGVP